MPILIGNTGFIGKHFADTWNFDKKINSSNLSELERASTDLVVCAGLPGQKWMANLKGKEDFENMSKLAKTLSTVRSKKILLISTIDVYDKHIEFDEDTLPNVVQQQPYGSNRAQFELLMRDKFEICKIVRLPGVFCEHLKKNLIYDLLHNRLDYIKNNYNLNSTYQYYNLHKVVNLCKSILDSDINILNVATEPITVKKILELRGINIKCNGTEDHYDIHTKFSMQLANKCGKYLETADEVLKEISELFIR